MHQYDDDDDDVATFSYITTFLPFKNNSDLYKLYLYLNPLFNLLAFNKCLTFHRRCQVSRVLHTCMKQSCVALAVVISSLKSVFTLESWGDE